MQKNKHLVNFIISIFLTATFFGILNTTHFFNVTLVIKLGLTASILLKSFIYYLTLFFILFIFHKKKDHEYFKTLGLSTKNLIKQIFIGIGIFSILVLYVILFSFITKTKPYEGSFSNFIDLPIFTLYYILILGFVEELIFRGYLLNKFYNLFKSKLLAILISSTIFGLWHFPMHYHFGGVIFTFIFGIILSSLKLNINGNIIISFAIAHGLYNSLNFWIPYLKNI